MAGLGLEDSFQSDSLTWLLAEASVASWLLAGGLSSLPHGTPHKASSHGSWLPPKQVIQEKERAWPNGSHGAFYSPISGVNYYHFHCVLLVTETNPGPIMRVNCTRYDYQEARTIGAILEAAYHIHEIGM